MNQQAIETVSGGDTSYRRLFNIRRANYAVLQSQIRKAPEKKTTVTKTSLRHAFDVAPMADMTPVEDAVLRRNEQGNWEMQPISPEKVSSPPYGVWSRSKDKEVELKPEAEKREKEKKPVVSKKTTEKVSDTPKDKTSEETKPSDKKRVPATDQTQRKIAHNSVKDNETRLKELRKDQRNLKRQRAKKDKIKERGTSEDLYRSPYKHGHNLCLHQHLIKDMYYNMKSIGNIRFYNKLLGTVFRVGSHYLMTAWHVIRYIINPYLRNGVSEYNWLRLRNQAVCVDFGDDGGPTFSLTGRYIYSNMKMDIAIVEIDRRGRRLPPPLHLSKYDTTSISRDVYFIGYGQPSDSRKRIDPFCEVVDKHDARIQAAKESILNKSDLRTIVRLQGLNPSLLIRSYDDIDLSYRFVVQCATELGASGAPAISEADGNVVGIFVSGIPHFYYEFEKRGLKNIALLQKNTSNKVRFEMCTKTSSIYESLRGRSPSLADEIFSTRLHLTLPASASHKPRSG